MLKPRIFLTDSVGYNLFGIDIAVASPEVDGVASGYIEEEGVLELGTAVETYEYLYETGKAEDGDERKERYLIPASSSNKETPPRATNYYKQLPDNIRGRVKGRSGEREEYLVGGRTRGTRPYSLILAPAVVITSGGKAFAYSPAYL
ncbi:hypothetical protein QBC39DRAFT_333462 [Podospora conica]|nr:hypothetical protein QBC39DRAFT_333462 [Schizothecium conicum]